MLSLFLGNHTIDFGTIGLCPMEVATDTNKYTSYSPIDMHNAITGLSSDKIDLHILFSPSLLIATVVEAECNSKTVHITEV